MAIAGTELRSVVLTLDPRRGFSSAGGQAGTPCYSHGRSAMTAIAGAQQATRFGGPVLACEPATEFGVAMSDRRDAPDGGPGNVTLLERWRRPPPPDRSREAPGQPVAFGVELPARGDIVFSIAALTQLITIADQAGVDAADDLGRAIAALRRRLRANAVGLPPALEEMIGRLETDGERVELHPLPGGRP